MYSCNHLNDLCKQTIHKWIQTHLFSVDGNLNQTAIDHSFVNGVVKYTYITHDDFFQSIEETINTDRIKFNFTGCSISGPFNLFMFIQQHNKEYITSFPTEFKEEIKDLIYQHELFQNIQIINIKSLLGAYFLYYFTQHKNEIYDIVLEYKIQVMNQYFDV